MRYANITPITIIYNKPQATKLYVTIINDNLTNQAIFMSTLYSADMEVLLNQSIICEGEDYTNWDGNNDFPFTFCATNLGVEIIDFGDDTPPVIEETEELEDNEE